MPHKSIGYPEILYKAQLFQYENVSWIHYINYEKALPTRSPGLGLEGEFFTVEPLRFQPGDFSLSMKAPDRIKHFKITASGDQYVIGQRTFDTVDDLVTHYLKQPIYTTDSGQKMFLTRPVNKQQVPRNAFS